MANQQNGLAFPAPRPSAPRSTLLRSLPAPVPSRSRPAPARVRVPPSDRPPTHRCLPSLRVCAPVLAPCPAGPPRVSPGLAGRFASLPRAFMWSIWHQAVATNSWRGCFNPNINQACPSCDSGVRETYSHRFYECHQARSVWNFCFRVIHLL